MTFTEEITAEIGAFPAGQAQVLKVQLVIDGHRLTGEFHYTGVMRRLVDYLNALDSGYATIVNGSIGSAQRFDDEGKRFDVAQVRRDAILFAVPLNDTPPAGSSPETVLKVPVPTTLGLPGYDITGNTFHAPQADPVGAPVLAGRNFIAMTEAVVRPTFKAKIQREDLVVVNLARVLVYAPNPHGS